MNYTVDEILRICDFSFQLGQEIKRHLEEMVTQEEAEEMAGVSYDSGYEDGCDKTKESVKSCLFQIVGSDLDDDALIAKIGKYAEDL